MNGLLKKLLLSSAAFVMAGGLALNAAEFKVDVPHTTVGFKVKHMMVSNTKGYFSDFDGKIDYDLKEKKFNVFEGVVKVASLDTKNEKRDEHLRSNDFFDVTKYPEMKFVMTEYEPGKLIGNLTIKDVTKKVEFALDFGGVAEDPWGNTRIGFTAEATINRLDYGLKWNKVLETGGLLVGDDVNIIIELEGIEK